MKLRHLLAALVFIVGNGSSAFAQEPFYQGKVVRIVVGFSPGGGFDVYSRTIARHLGKHIPGNPKIIVENMTGAGSMVAANHVYKVARPDGLTIGNVNGSLFMQQLLGRSGIEFDARKFGYLGVPVRDSSVCPLTKASGITDIKKWMASKTPVKLGATGPGSLTDAIPKILKVALGLPIQLVSGYKGITDIRLAAESGELAGACGWAWDSVKATWGKALQSGDAVVVLQTIPAPHPELPKVPLAIDFAKTEDARQLIQAGIHDQTTMTFSYVLPPGTPNDRLQVLRGAFMKTMSDAEFLADTKKSKLGIGALTGEELEQTVTNMFKLDPAMVSKLREILQ
jgi:tripartite-type tricarboxylate transporter receptor subunit TctC